ncbi:hypothetical protein M2164_000281 [Streptomyces sp. SAI-208]|jgi:hypothetical protein|nr:hypothetical protein [Streptomyces sp. SAI-117]MDH6589962.1 hypothetical protein [Streptomyces sp. SAI-133]MDH6604646.1 hypothetical protein [Streptomyces sp. SAI-208]
MAPAPWWAWSARARICRVRQDWTMLWAGAAVRSCMRPGVVRENHSGVPSGLAITCTFMPCLRCFID